MKTSESGFDARSEESLLADICVECGYTDRETVNKYLGKVIAAKVDGKAIDFIELLVMDKIITGKQMYEIENIKNIQSGHSKIKGYELIELIGKGGMGLVYKARQVSMDRIVALKIMYPSLASDKKYVERFLREARASAKLNNPNIVSGIDIGESEGIYYFAMEYVDGQTLSRILKRGGALDELRSLQIASQVSRALQHAHTQGIIHRDIKPDNIILTSEGVPKLGDLGLAKVDKAGTHTEAGITLGTPNYISPEQAKGVENIDARADIYSLGATLYHMLTGETPYAGTAAIVMTKHVNEPVPDPWKVNKNITAFTRVIVMKMMAKNPDHRYNTANDVANALENAIKQLFTPKEDPKPEIERPKQFPVKSRSHNHGHRIPGSKGRTHRTRKNLEPPNSKEVEAPERLLPPPPPAVSQFDETSQQDAIEISADDETVDLQEVINENSYDMDETADLTEIAKKEEDFDPDETTDRRAITAIREPRHEEDDEDKVQPAPPPVDPKKALEKYAKRGAIRKMIRRRKK